MHILLCADETPLSRPALTLGERLALALRAEVTLLLASPYSPSPTLTTVATDISARLGALKLPCTMRTRTDIPRRAIIAQAETVAYDLIVMGLLERGRIRRWLRGSSVRRVLQNVAAPILIVPSDRPALKRILLCSSDLWYPSEMIHLVGQIAQATQAEVTLLYVIPQPTLHYPALKEVEDAWGALLQTDTPQGRNLKAGRDALRALGVETWISLRHGIVREQIMTEIREGEYDLVALGSTYAAQSMRRFYVPSITELVVEQAHRPVLVVRHRD
ncbi:MAG TPA: universal stress protein [Anaerolineae bacterium]|mgnify:CR=1 FL=1|nr:universal stress protein [Anaerolineae bacterium]HQK14424.1 universal stress protein [Anaerolineae bacterium]